MIRVSLIAISLGFSFQVFCQVNLSPNVLASPFQGQQFKMKSDQDVEGTPFLYDDWRPAEVTLSSGETYQLQKVNFDAAGSRFIYSVNDTMFEFQANVKQIKISGDNNSSEPASQIIFRNDLLPQETEFVQVLTQGKITILRKFSKKPEGENYSNGIVNNTRKYVLHTEDVALVDNKVVPFKYSSSDLQQLTSDKKDQVDSYIKSNKLKPKKEDDFLKSVNFYNSIN